MTAWCPLCAKAPRVVTEPAARYRGFRVPSARLPGADYGRGVFFVTIVTAGRAAWFGAVADGGVIPS